MPCEGCQVQFTVFKRKRSCSECRRYYCSNCLSSLKRNNGSGSGLSLLLCQRCAIFAKRPLLRADLLQLKPKDLIFYLQSKHISTAGCVEKDELVCLVLNHAQQVDANLLNGHAGTGFHGRASADTTNSFDSIKQTCQNFFTNISDNLTESFSNLDNRENANKQHQQQSQRHAPYNNERHGPTVEQQPIRVHTREIPTYASQQQQQRTPDTQPQQPQMPVTTTTTKTTRTTTSPTVHSIRTASVVGTTTPNGSVNLANTNTSTPNTSSSPTYSGSGCSTVSSARVQNDLDLNEAASTSTLSTASKRTDEHNKSDCECSDDEMIADFSARHSLKTDTASQQYTPEQQHNNDDARENIGPSTSNASTNYSKVGSFSSKVDVCDVSSQSSFEELGAIGGISDESRPTTETNSSFNMEQWMMLEVPTTTNESSSSEHMEAVDVNKERKLVAKTQKPDLPKLRLNQQQRKPKVQRRRSDSYLSRRHNELLTPTSPTAPNLSQLNQSALTIDEHMHPCEVAVAGASASDEPTSHRRQSCTRCGKNKTNLRHQVEKMRRHLESAQMSDEDIKREIKEFLEYLEMRTKSMDHSESETVGSSMSAANLTQVATMQSPSPMDDNDGIHVYASTSSYDGGESRFINLEDFDNMDDLECLTVKQLKEILMLHRVDYKGCCEKQELLERVERLWKNLKTTPAVEKLPTDELCKICMDAPIECVILECGHMATCTNCGKVLSECPICRQYIVRVVRFFRA